MYGTSKERTVYESTHLDLPRAAVVAGLCQALERAAATHDMAIILPRGSRGNKTQAGSVWGRGKGDDNSIRDSVAVEWGSLLL